MYHFNEMVGGGNCTLCGSPNTNKTNCPLNPNATHPNLEKHPLAGAKKSVIKTPEPAIVSEAPKNIRVAAVCDLNRDKTAELYEKIDNLDDMRGTFHNLLYTHNTLIPTFLLMLTGAYSFIRCCKVSWNNEEVPVGRGAQFRYGLDSQYGEIKIILKPKFWENYALGVDLFTEQIVDKPQFYDFWGKSGYTADNSDLKYLLETEALNYNFRRLDEKLGLTNEGGSECIRMGKEILANKEKGLPPSVLSKAYPSWCNIQLHLGNNVKFDDILAVIVPAFLKDPKLKFNGVPITKILDSAQNDAVLPDGKPNPFRGKLIFTGSGDATKYYDYKSDSIAYKSGSHAAEKFYNELKSGRSAQGDYMHRSNRPFGNSSQVAVSAEEFVKEQQEYMKLLVKYGGTCI